MTVSAKLFFKLLSIISKGTPVGLIKVSGAVAPGDLLLCVRGKHLLFQGGFRTSEALGAGHSRYSPNL